MENIYTRLWQIHSGQYVQNFCQNWLSIVEDVTKAHWWFFGSNCHSLT